MTQLTKCCSNLQCSRPFLVNRFQADVSPSTEPGQIVCPHCGSRVTGDRASIFLTHALLAEEEMQFLELHAKASESMR